MAMFVLVTTSSWRDAGKMFRACPVPRTGTSRHVTPCWMDRSKTVTGRSRCSCKLLQSALSRRPGRLRVGGMGRSDGTSMDLPLLPGRRSASSAPSWLRRATKGPKAAATWAWKCSPIPGSGSSLASPVPVHGQPAVTTET